MRIFGDICRFGDIGTGIILVNNRELRRFSANSAISLPCLAFLGPNDFLLESTFYLYNLFEVLFLKVEDRLRPIKSSILQFN